MALPPTGATLNRMGLPRCVFMALAGGLATAMPTAASILAQVDEIVE